MSAFAHVAIDGPAGSGKTTVARALAERLGILYLDTGAMYRALAVLALRAEADPADGPAMLALARTHPIHVERVPDDPLRMRVFAGDDQLDDALYDGATSRIVSIVAAHPAVRAAMVARQQAVAAHGPVVMAGRDIGTVVLPDAPFKIFLTASVDERVRRRGAELAARGTDVDPAALRAEIEERDRLDASRPVAPLRAAPDATVIDSSGLDVAAVVGRILDLIRTRTRA